MGPGRLWSNCTSSTTHSASCDRLGQMYWPHLNSAANNPNVKFTVIINPSSGPGGDALPDANWRKAIPKLTAHSNVAVIGYVATCYGGRPISAVQRDITTYANWPTASGDASFAVHGIFFDEAAAELDDTKVTYYKQLTSQVKENKSFGPQNNVNTPVLAGAPHLQPKANQFSRWS